MVSVVYNGRQFRFRTSPSLFSPNAIDKGTLAMLSEVEFLSDDKILDIGCGYGVVGILAAGKAGEQAVTMCDISEQAVTYAKHNASLNGFSGLKVLRSDSYEEIEETDFSLILSNPPYHADFSVAKRFIEGGYQRLREGGRMIMVVKRLLWYQKKMTAVFGGVSVKEVNGYYVLTSEKRNRKIDMPKIESGKNKKGMSKKLLRKSRKKRRNKNPPETVGK